MPEAFAAGDELEANLAKLFDVLAYRASSRAADIEEAVDVVGLAPVMAILEVKRGNHETPDQDPVVGPFGHPPDQLPHSGFVDLIEHDGHR